MEKFGLNKKGDDLAKKEAHEYVDGFLARYYSSHRKIGKQVEKTPSKINKKIVETEDISPKECSNCGAKIFGGGKCPNCDLEQE